MSGPLVLVVDDAPEIVFIVQRYGREAGQQVVGCGNAEAASEYLRQTRPDLLLLDLNLPGMSGLELCRRLRATPAQADLPVALFTHWDRPADIAAGLEAGADFAIFKDLLCRPEAWQSRLAEILQPADGRSALASLSWTQARLPTSSPEAWLESINQALRHPSVRQLGPEVLTVLASRALRRAELSFAREWLLPGGLTLDVARIAPALRPEAVAALVAALAEQLWRVFGTAEGAPVWAALAVVFSSDS